MDYRRLGASGLKDSKICLGAMMFGERADEATAARIVKSAFAVRGATGFEVGAVPLK